MDILRGLVLLLLTMASALHARNPRSEPRDEARAQRQAHGAQAVTRCENCVHNDNGRIKRDRAARRAFQSLHPCPSTGRTTGACPGYVVDHILPLKRGGTDSPDNMQCQTLEAAKAKDRIEWIFN